jgi:hypothetical protein
MSNFLGYVPLFMGLLLMLAGVPLFLKFYEVTQNLTSSTLLTITYELIILISFFLAKVWQRVESKWADRVANWLDLILTSLFSGYRTKYLEFLTYQHRMFDVKGLSTQGLYSLELEQVFVGMNLVPVRSGDEVSKNLLRAPSLEDDKNTSSIWEYLQMQLPTRSFVILGAPGSGKTTLLKNITLILSSKRAIRRRVGAPRLLPILLFLRDHQRSIKENPNLPLAQLIQDQFADRQAPLPPTGWLENQLQSGACIVMLDGLDEVADPQTRRILVDWVEQCMAAYGRNCFIVTSRPHGYVSNPLSNVLLLQAMPFSAQQVEQFVYNWYLANEVIASHKDDSGVREDARRGAIDLLERIKSSKEISQLAVNPLLLTMVITIHRYRSSLPGRRVELYSEIVDVFLGKRQQARGLELEMTPSQKGRVLQALAYEMTKRKIRSIEIAKAETIIVEPLSGIAPDVMPSEFLREVENSSGLLLEVENEIYSFSHITFQEYLTSIYIIEERLEEILQQQINDEWWHETILLYCAQTDGSQIINACLSKLNVSTLNLAIRCMEEAREINSTVRNDFNNAILASLNASDPDLRVLALKASGQIVPPSLFYETYNFFKAAGFDCQNLESEHNSALRCKPSIPEWEAEIWKARLGTSLFVQVFANRNLNRDDIINVYEAAQLEVGNTSIIVIIVNQTLSISAWDEINALRFGNGVHIVPIDDIIIQHGRETNREQEELEIQLNRSMGRQDYYDVRDAITDRRNFFGRHELATELLGALNQNHHLALLGLRKMGKSSFLQYLRDQVPYPVSYIDLQNGCLDPSGRLSTTIYSRILDGWQASIKVKLQDFEWVRPELSEDPSIAFAETTRELLKHLTQINKSLRLGIFLDEFDLCLPRRYSVSSKDFSDQQIEFDLASLQSYLLLARTLRGLTEETKQIALVVAGVNPGFYRTNFWGDNAQNPLYRFFRVEYLGPLTAESCIEMVKNIGKQMNLLYTDDALSFIATTSGGHPYLARQLCSLAYKRRDTRQTGVITLHEMQSAANLFLSHPDYNDSLEGIWQEATRPSIWPESIQLENKRILQHLARHKQANDLDISSNSKNTIECENSIEELKLRHIITEAKDNLIITFDLFRRWVEKYQKR